MDQGQQPQSPVADAQRRGDGGVVRRKSQGGSQRLKRGLGSTNGGLVGVQRPAEPGTGVGREVAGAHFRRVAMNSDQAQVIIVQKPYGGCVAGESAL